MRKRTWLVAEFLLLSAIVVTGMAQTQSATSIAAGTITENTVKKSLKEGKTVLGPGVTATSVDVAATLANVGYDYLWIEMEHSSLTLETVHEMILATRGLKAMPFVRIPVNEPWVAKRVMDIGALGVIFPFVSTRALAEQAVRSCKYPPQGIRGFSPGLAAARWGMSVPEYVKFANENVMVVVQIEEKEAVENIEAIAAVPGIDVLFIGAYDLSYSLGLGGNITAPIVEDAVNKVLAAARKHNIAVGYIASNPVEVNKRIAQGFRFFLTGNDLGSMTAGAREILTKVQRDETGVPKANPQDKK